MFVFVKCMFEKAHTSCAFSYKENQIQTSLFSFFHGMKDFYLFFLEGEQLKFKHLLHFKHFIYQLYMAIDTKIGMEIICLHSYIYKKENKHFNIQ